MNHAHPIHKASVAPILGGMVALVSALMILGSVCRSPSAAPPATSEGTPRTPDAQPVHCLVYGKYCLSALLHGQ
ncbi:hypothetical protein BLA23254_04054 [Burkholderia lata]|uniref:Uncharacterized protein n=1 Tax=Burkholderia lata (strain ATCC 17760 / DSM 23089 / LMG 22485 / NCIMB 9086 / R18194 / 383) TaxID=482957 RepID=A0A6P2N336_BURL3|nr:hypothetical protein [Burkholderia lata]VWB85786.1 hypothetical protein BLA23254_04054 [Burkholderia lata]